MIVLLVPVYKFLLKQMFTIEYRHIIKIILLFFYKKIFLLLYFNKLLINIIYI